MNPWAGRSTPIRVLGVALLVLGAASGSAPAFAQHGGHEPPMPAAALHPMEIPKFQEALVVPPPMPRSGKLQQRGAKNIDYYEIAVRQFRQQILPSGLPQTTVSGYGAIDAPQTFHYPSFTIEAKWKKPVRVKWINQLVKNPAVCYDPAIAAKGDACNFLPHLLPIDQTLHWANPPGECMHAGKDRDCRGMSPEPYAGPVPMIVHVHGAETFDWADGYPEAWYLPAADDIPAGYHASGSFFDHFLGSAQGFDAANPIAWEPGSATFQYPNQQEATTLWYHDHALGMTRQNVYAGPAGFYLLRGGPGDEVKGKLPGPAPASGDPPGKAYYEIPIAIQDRSFNQDGSLFYPDNRAFFEGLTPDRLQVPFIHQDVVYEDGTNLGPSDVSPIWNPEFFGNAIVVNGKTWPFLEVEPRRYRLRLLNGCSSRFLILRLSDGRPFWQIGAEQGFLPAPIELDELLMGPAERADVIVDFTGLAPGTSVTLLNFGPDEPFGGGEPGIDFEPAHAMTTGQVMQFRVVPLRGPDTSTPPARLRLPLPPALGVSTATRRVSLNEVDSAVVRVEEDADGNVVLDLDGEPFGPASALLGTVGADGVGLPVMWSEPTTENVTRAGDTETWEIFNYTADAHPIHIHLVQFRVVDRQALAYDENGAATVVGAPRAPAPWEAGYKDTVIAYPGEVTRVRATFPLEGLFVWHCHILEHEDNEMMRPYCVGNASACRHHNAGDGGHGGM